MAQTRSNDGPMPLGQMLSEFQVEPLRVAGAYADLSDSLYSVIDRADDRLAVIDCHQLAVDLGDLRIAGLELADRLILALNAVLDARAILAEAIPPDEPDEEGGEHAIS